MLIRYLGIRVASVTFMDRGSWLEIKSRFVWDLITQTRKVSPATLDRCFLGGLSKHPKRSIFKVCCRRQRQWSGKSAGAASAISQSRVLGCLLGGIEDLRLGFVAYPTHLRRCLRPGYCVGKRGTPSDGPTTTTPHNESTLSSLTCHPAFAQATRYAHCSNV
jgi:hypothetical protein